MHLNLRPEKILVINLAFIGDVLLSTPMIRALKGNYWDAAVDMMVVPLTKPIAEGNPYINEVLTYDKKDKHKKLGNLWELIQTVRNRKYDLVVCTNFAPRGAMMAFVAGIPFRVGYDAQHGKWFLTHAVSAQRKTVRHESENYLDLLMPLGILTEDASLDFKINDSDIKTMRVKLGLIPFQRASRPIIAICPMGRHPKRKWAADDCAHLIKNISEIADCYLIGNQSQEAELNNINKTSGNLAKVLAGTLSLGELAAFIHEIALLVSVDTAPLHIAEAVKTPVIALFGSADPMIWGPRGESSKIFTAGLDCSPCWGDCQNNLCMQSLDVAAIIATAVDILKSGRRRT